jgi:hypothetical protein
MKFTERREFLYDPEVFKRTDTQTALRIHDEYIRRSSGQPYPVFYEIDRSPESFDPLWHQPVSTRTQYVRILQVPCIVQFDKMNWSLRRQGRYAEQKIRFWVSNLTLQTLDYFPLPGDLVYWNGYRTEIVTPEFEPNSFWGQTNVWLGVIYSAAIVPEGDAKPMLNPSKPMPVEIAPEAPLPFKTTPIDKSVPAGNPIANTEYIKPLKPVS